MFRPVLLTLTITSATLVSGCCGNANPKATTATTMSKPTTDVVPTDNPPADDTGPSRAWPPTRREKIVDTLHGVDVADPYRWLEDEKAPAVKAWMAEQDGYARAELAKLPGREALLARLGELMYYDAISAPRHFKGRYFFSRKHAEKEKSVVYWKAGAKGTERVLFDPNTWSSDGSTSLHGWWPSHDGMRVAYSVSENNADETVTRIMDVATGKDLPDVIAGTKYADASWTPDGSGFYYTWVPPADSVPTADRPGFAELRFHLVGTDPSTDTVAHPATGDAKTFLGGGVSEDGHWLLVAIQHGWNSSDWYFKDLRKKAAAWSPLVVGVDANFSVMAWRDKFYVNTNEAAARYQVFKVEPAKPARANWKLIVAESDATLESMNIVGEHLVLGYLRKAASETKVFTLDGKFVRDVPLPPLGTSGGIVGNPDEDTGYFGYSSFTEPSVIYETSIKTGKVTEWARVTLPIDTSKFEAEQVTYPSKDGTPVTMFLIRSKTAVRDGKNPTILYGYGGFNVSLTPGFSSSRMVWLEQGGMLAIPNLRGGGEYGEDWHKDGMLANKQNVFDDFIAAAHYLVDEKWTSPEHLAIQGGSNGGLLVGAAMVQAPELFSAVLCAVPLLDMIRYPKFGSGATWIPEYGDPDDAAQFATLLAYSPYHHVVAGTAYPALLMDSADHDDRVDPMHARKFTAAIQRATSGNAPTMIRIETNAGHGGADMVKSTVERTADQFAFLLSRLR